ncbi:MAG: aldose 1-epimerase family protein [Candidatus Dormiibacterota bacterium]
MTPPPSGRQITLRHGDQELTVVEVGAGLRAFTWGGRDVLDAYPVSEIAPGAHGQALLPWPNRLQDGAYDFGGARHQTPISEPERDNAIHGLTRWLNWEVRAAGPARAELATLLHPQPGYPFTLALQLDYELADDGLTVTLSATNEGDGPLPFGAGFHPYLSPGGPAVDSARLRLPVATALEVNERMLPTGQTHAIGGEDDFRQLRAIGSQVLDGCFTELERDADGRARVELAGADGRTVTLWLDESWPFVQIYSGDTLPAGLRRQGLAIEPMTCPANAFRSGTGLLTLAPAQTFRGSWGLRLT